MKRIEFSAEVGYHHGFPELRSDKAMLKAMPNSTTSARFLAAAVWFLPCALVIAAPLLSLEAHPAAASLVYLLFSGLCHQIPERSFDIAGFPFAVCHRCSGIYLGLFLGSLTGKICIHRSYRIRRVCILSAAAPLAIDFLLSLTGIWSGNGILRFLTGLVFGTMLSSVFTQGMREFLAESGWNRFILFARGTENG
jgi:uncharacterized membrane protein